MRTGTSVARDRPGTFPIVRAFDDLPDPSGLTLVQFDAHQDYTDDKYGVRYSHDNHMRRSSELAHVRQIVQIGLRGVIERFEPWEAAQRLHDQRHVGINCARAHRRTRTRQPRLGQYPSDGVAV
jgi:arginase family enzyme